MSSLHSCSASWRCSIASEIWEEMGVEIKRTHFSFRHMLYLKGKKKIQPLEITKKSYLGTYEKEFYHLNRLPRLTDCAAWRKTTHSRERNLQRYYITAYKQEQQTWSNQPPLTLTWCFCAVNISTTTALFSTPFLGWVVALHLRESITHLCCIFSLEMAVQGLSWLG